MPDPKSRKSQSSQAAIFNPDLQASQNSVLNGSVIPSDVAVAIQGMRGPAGSTAEPDSSTPPPQSVLDALTSDSNVPPAPSFLADQPHNNPEPTDPLADIAGSMKGRFDQQKPQLAPPMPAKESLGHKIMRFLPMAGAVGGALEAAGGPVGRPAQGAEMLQHEFDTERAHAMAKEKLQNVEIPEAQARSNYYNSLNPTKVGVAKIGAEAKENVADTSADAKVALGRYKAVPGVGLFDTQTQQVIPGTSQGVMVTQDILSAYPNIPKDFLGKPVKLTDLAAIDRSAAMNMVPVQGAKGPALVNKKKGTAKDLGLGSPAIAARQSNVSDVNDNGNIVPMTDAQRLTAGAPKAQTLVSTGKATNTVYQPALDADMRLKQMYQQATDVSGASDQALLFNHIAMTGGAVKGLRMGEYLTEAHRKARGIPEDLAVMWNRLATGESLSPQQRQNFVHLAESVRQTQWDRARRQAPLIGAANEPAPDPDLPELNEMPSTAPVKSNSPSPRQRATPDVNRKTTPTSGGKKDSLGIL